MPLHLEDFLEKLLKGNAGCLGASLRSRPDEKPKIVISAQDAPILKTINSEINKLMGVYTSVALAQPDGIIRELDKTYTLTIEEDKINKLCHELNVDFTFNELRDEVLVKPFGDKIEMEFTKKASPPEEVIIKPLNEKVPITPKPQPPDFTFQEFKQAYSKAYHSTFFRNPLSKMRIAMWWGKVKSTEDVLNFVAKHPSCKRSLSVIAKLRVGKR